MAGKETFNPINPNEVHIWWAKTDSPEYDVPQMLSVLSEDEKARADRFHFPHHRRRFIASHALLRTILGSYLKISPDALILKDDSRGKPHLENRSTCPGLCFNLSHSHEIALIGISLDRRLGVDVEFVRPLSNMESISRRYFSEAETNAIVNLPPSERLARFFKYWTIKEAYLKATGKGLSGLQEVQIPWDENNIMLQSKADIGGKEEVTQAYIEYVEESDDAANDGMRMNATWYKSDANDLVVTDASHKTWSLHSLYPAPEYAAAFAAEGNNAVIPVIREFSSMLFK